MTNHAPRTLGDLGENAAASYLQANGLTVLARNWRVGAGELRGELDLLCRDGDTLVVVEVKTRRGERTGGPLQAVTPRKQARIRALTAAFLRDAGLRVATVRFDVVGVSVRGDGLGAGDVRLQHVREAF